MRAQLSLELLVYISLAGLSFLFAISAANKASAREAGSIQSFEVSQFVSSVSSEISAGSASAFGAFVPRGLCNSTLNGDSLLTASGAFYFPERLRAASGALCPDDAYATLRLSYSNGTALLERVS